MNQLSLGALCAMALTLFVVAYNIAVFPAIMPVLLREFGSSVGYVQSILVLFSLVTAAFAPTAENVCRYFGRTRVFLVSLILYGIGIAATALSPTMAVLAVSFIVLCGFGAAALVSTPWAIADLDRRAAIALTVATTAGGSGALVGGFFASGIGWRWSFIPSLLVLLAIFLFARRLPKVPAQADQLIDWVGGLLSFAGFGLVLMGISLGGEFGWWEPRREFSIGGVILPPFAVSIVPTLIAVGVIAIGLFVFRQRRQSNRRRVSLVGVGLLRKPLFVLATLVATLQTLVSTGVQFNLYQFLPVTVGLDPFRTALAVMPYPAAVAIVTVAAKSLRFGRLLAPKQIVFAGLALVGVGILMIYARIHLGVRAIDLLPGLIVMGSGSGLFLATIGDLAYSATTPDEKPEGSAIFNPMQNLGSSLGRAILGTLLVLAASREVVDGVAAHLGKTVPPSERSRLIFTLQEMVQSLPRGDVIANILGRLPAWMQPILYSIEREAAASGIRASLLVALGAIALCFLLAQTLPKFASQTDGVSS